MILGRFAPFTALACGLCFLIGCASPRNDVNRVSADLEHRSGHTLTNAKPGEIVLPASVSFDDGLSEDEAVTLALWNNAAFQETLADLGLSRADLVQAGMLPNPTLSMLFPVGAKPFELTAKYPLEAFWLRPRRVAAAKLDYERTAHRLVQSGLDLIRDVRLACADLGLANQRLVLAETTEKLNRAIAEQARRDSAPEKRANWKPRARTSTRCKPVNSSPVPHKMRAWPANDCAFRWDSASIIGRAASGNLPCRPA